jgi:hypothetical protein
MEHLEGDVPLQDGVEGLEDDAETARAELALDLIGADLLRGERGRVSGESLSRLKRLSPLAARSF